MVPCFVFLFFFFIPWHCVEGGGDGDTESAYLYTSIQGEGLERSEEKWHINASRAVVVGLYVALAGGEWSVSCGICSDRLVSGYLCSYLYISMLCCVISPG